MNNKIKMDERELNSLENITESTMGKQIIQAKEVYSLEPNRMLMSRTKNFSFVNIQFGSCEVRRLIWTLEKTAILDSSSHVKVAWSV